MHILVVNDDGPPSSKASPYILSLVRTLQSSGHTVSVILPHIQRSWIGKAHFVGQLITPTYYQPPALSGDVDSGTTHEFPLPASVQGEEWILVDGTPATCTQLGLHHFFHTRGPVDLVISGPNYGRNCTSLFALSSGTLGGALEAAAFKKRAIAISYAFFSRELDQSVLDAATKLSVKIVEYLEKNWGADVELYSVNVPLIAGVETKQVFFTNMLENYWSGGCAFDEVNVESKAINEKERGEENEIKIREQAENGSVDSKNQTKIHDSMIHARHKHRHFQWAPKFADVYRSVEQSEAGNDGWAIRQGYTSITPLRATFTAARSHRYGEVNLDSLIDSSSISVPTLPELLTTLSFYAHIAYEDDYVQPFIIQAFNTVLKPGSFLLVDKPPGARYLSSVTKHLQIMQYELLPHEALLTNPTTQFGNSYTIRKALIRKHFLSQTIASWTAKNPTSSLKDHVPLTLAFELDYAEFLEDALVEAWEVQKSWERNESQEPVSREWWILKPSMSDKGQGIRLFSSQEELQNIFNEWEESNPSDDDEDAGSDTLDVSNNGQESKGLMTSRLRHFIIQPYIPPLLLPTQNNRKFHIRTYTLAVGALEVYVYADMLALFSAHPYKGPGLSNPNDNLAIHLTNTSLQTSSNQTTHQQQEQLVHTLSSLSPTSINESNPWTPSQTISQILPLTASLFRAAAAQPTSFQPLPNCFEIFGLDWLVDSDGKVWLLEVNSFPDFGQTGVELGERIVGGFWRGVVGVVGGCWFGDCVVEDMTGADDRVEGGEYVGRGMWKVLDVDMGRR